MRAHRTGRNKTPARKQIYQHALPVKYIISDIYIFDVGMVRRTKRYTKRRGRKGTRGAKRRGTSRKRSRSSKRRTRRTRRKVGVFSASKTKSVKKAPSAGIKPAVKTNHDHAFERKCMFCNEPGHWKECKNKDCVMNDYQDSAKWEKSIMEESKIKGKAPYRKKNMKDEHWKVFYPKYKSYFEKERENRKKYKRNIPKNTSDSS